MARYWPATPLEIAEPCNSPWEDMQGNANVRHCAECSRDVYNVAAMTPRQIKAMLARPGPLPCLRIARRDDGSLLVAEEARSAPAYGAWAGAAMAALVSISTAVASAQSMTLGKMRVPPTVYSGQVLGPGGKPAPKATVYLSRSVDGKDQRVEAQTDAAGMFHLAASPGSWRVGAYGGPDGPSMAAEQPVTLGAGEQKAAKPLQMERITVTAGIPPPPPKKTTK